MTQESGGRPDMFSGDDPMLREPKGIAEEVGRESLAPLAEPAYRGSLEERMERLDELIEGSR